MNFESDSSKDGKLEFGYEDGWHWSSNGGNYKNGRDFFWIHWEINDLRPSNVKLHVECPPADAEPEMNAIKHEIVEAFLSPNFKKILEQNGYSYAENRKVKSADIRQNK